MAYRIAALAANAVNLLTLEAVLSQGLLPRALNTSRPTVLTTVHHHTHIAHAQEIKQLTANPHIRFVPYFAPLVYAHHADSKITHQPGNPPRVSLLVGDSNPPLQSSLDPVRVITLEEVCRAFPEKVPLSMRSRESSLAREGLERRIGMQMSRERVIQFQNILLVSPAVKMWDEAFQVILDCQPAPLLVPYLKQPPVRDELYELTLEDFLSGLGKVYETVSSAVKTHPPLSVVRFDQRRQLDWIITEVASGAQQMSIDGYFFSTPPKVGSCSGVSVIESLAGAL